MTKRETPVRTKEKFFVNEKEEEAGRGNGFDLRNSRAKRKKYILLSKTSLVDQCLDTLCLQICHLRDVAPIKHPIKKHIYV